MPAGMRSPFVLPAPDIPLPEHLDLKRISLPSAASGTAMKPAETTTAMTVFSLAVITFPPCPSGDTGPRPQATITRAGDFGQRQALASGVASIDRDLDERSPGRRPEQRGAHCAVSFHRGPAA